MPANGPSFRPYPVTGLRRITRRDAAFESAIARWLAARPLGAKLAALVGGPTSARVIGCSGDVPLDPHAAFAEVRSGGLSIVVAAASRPIRRLAQRWLGGPAELDAPRPLAPSEHAIWALVVAAALDDLGLAAEVWPYSDARPGSDLRAVELEVVLADQTVVVVAFVPAAVEVRLPPARPVPGWTFDLPILVARAAIARSALATLAVRDTITVDRALELEIGEGTIRLSAAPRAVEATVVTGYLPRDMAMPDDAHVELTVQLGSARMTLRQLADLAVGQLVPLGRPLAGPFEVRAAGRVIGQGELVDIEGEVGVRIVSIPQE